MAKHIDGTERIQRVISASPEQQAAIDQILDGRVENEAPTQTGPLLLNMIAAARFLGVSRTTLWRLIKNDEIPKIELLPGSYRVRRADLEALCK